MCNIYFSKHLGKLSRKDDKASLLVRVTGQNLGCFSEH